MGALTFDALLRSLKQGAPDAVYYLHGEEDELKDEAVRALVERAVDPAARDFNLDQRAAADLERLAPLCAGRPATREEVAALVGVRRGETLQDFVDAALERRAADAARLVEAVLEQAGMSGVRMLSALGTALIGTALARAELDRDAPRGGGPRHDRLEAALLSHPRPARPYALGSWEQTALRWARWAGLWSAGELRHALRRALDADRALKSSTLSDEAGILEQLVLPWGVRAREAA